MTNINRIERGATVHTEDGSFGQVYQVIVDPDTKDLTHVVVAPSGGGEHLMIPADMVQSTDSTSVTLNTTTAALEGMRGELRYNEADFQAVNPEEVEGAHATMAQSGGQVITHASRDSLAMGDTGSTTTAYSNDTGATTTMTSGEGTDTTGGTPSGPTGTGQQRKGKDLVGMPIVSFADGEKIGDVKDILFDPEQNRVVALLTSEGGFLSSARAILWQNLKTVGHDAILVPDRSAEIKADSDRYLKRIMENDNILKKTKVYTEDGRDLGEIGDMFIDDSTGEVVGYEVSGGMLASKLKGMKFMPAPDTLTVGQDAAFVPNEVGDAMQAQVGGLQGTAQDLGASASSQLSTARDAAQELGATASDKISTARDKVATTTADQQRSFVIGKPTRSDVTSDTGEVLVPTGKVVDESDVAKAESAGKLNALFLAAGGGAAGGLLDTVKAKAGELSDKASTSMAGQRDSQLDNSIGKTAGRDVYADDGTAVALQGTVVDYGTVERSRAYGKENQLIAAVGAASTQESFASAKEGISGTFSTIKAKIEEVSADQREKNEQRRINEAVGRPVTRVILDRQDNVILETAQIVTNQAVERARAAGVLDVLLSSVSTAQPELSSDALHSGVSGQASLESQYEQKRKPEDPIT
ncbi:MAG: PRC-barrel domain-containing protein [Chloroflexota bacterium]|nr:PRC-barrel domain-containing protein [Chloroflexota bacterium]